MLLSFIACTPSLVIFGRDKNRSEIKTLRQHTKYNALDSIKVSHALANSPEYHERRKLEGGHIDGAIE